MFQLTRAMLTSLRRPLGSAQENCQRLRRQPGQAQDRGRSCPSELQRFQGALFQDGPGRASGSLEGFLGGPKTTKKVTATRGHLNILSRGGRVWEGGWRQGVRRR